MATKLQPLTSNLIYPSNLLQNDDSSHAIIFHIMYVADIKFDKNTGRSQRANGTGGVLADKALDSLKDVSLKSIGSAIDKLSGQVKPLAEKIGQSIGSGEFANAAGDAINTALNATFKAATPTSKKTRLNTSIMLYMPQDGVKTSYSVNYESEDLGIAGALANSLGNGGTISDFVASMGKAAPRAVAGVASSILDGGGLLQKAGIPINTSGTLEAASRTTLNPRKEQLFKGVEYRRFGFTHIFTPTSRKECDTVRKIIETFKLHMHPSLAYDGFYYNYPSEFEIEYHFAGERNKYLDGIASCALVDLSLQYGSGSSWQTLLNGNPTHITMSTTFTELEILTQERIIRDQL